MFLPMLILFVVSVLEFMEITKFQLSIAYNLVVAYFLTIYLRGNITSSNRVVRVYLAFIFLFFVFYVFNINISYEIAGDLDLSRLRILNLNQNQIGIFLALAFILSLNLLNGFTRLFFIFILLSLMLETASRLSMISIFFAVIFFIYDKFKGLRFFATIILFIFLVSILSIIYSENVMLTRMNELFINGGLSARDVIFFTIFEDIEIDYWSGIGYLGYVNASRGLIGDGDLSPHNVFLEIFLYSGAIGLMIFIFFILQLYKYRSSFCALNKTVFISIFVLFLGILFSSQFFENRLSWFLLVIMLNSQYFLPVEEKSPYFH